MLASGAISEIALTFLTSEDFDTQLNKALAIVGKKLDVSRCYLFLDSDDGKTTSNTHEWCNTGVQSQIDRWQNVPYSMIPTWKEIIENEQIYAVSDTRTLAADIRTALEEDEIKSIILAPLRVNGTVKGFLGFDECTRQRVWGSIEIETLKMIMSLISGAYSKKILSEKLAASEENFRSFFNSMDDIILVGNLEGRIVFASDGASRKLGYTLEEFRNKSIIDLHPEDKQEEARQILAAILRRDTRQCPLELETWDRIRIPVDTRVCFGQWDGQECIFGISKDLSSEQAALQKFERLFRNNPAPMALSLVDSRNIIDINDSFVERIGYSREEVIGQSSIDIGLFVNDDRWLAVKEELLETGTVHNRELVVRHRDGSHLYGLFSGDVVEAQGQKYLLTVMVDITEQVRLRSELEIEHSRLAHIIEGTRLGTWEWNVQTKEIIFNERWAEIIGYTLEEMGPMTEDTWKAFVHPDDLKEASRRVMLHFEGITDYYESEIRVKHKDGHWVWIQDRGKFIERDSEGIPLKMYGTHTDISERKAMEERIRELAIRDPLTEVYNRRYIYDRLEEFGAEYVRRGRNFCVSILDLDHFKAVNDTHGHQCGDFVLKEFASTIGSLIRQYDLLGRYGGEEFIIISGSTSGIETSSMIERIMTELREKTFPFGEKDIRFTFSCGVADSSEINKDEFSVDAMIALSDKRLYVAKAAGRDQCIGPVVQI